METLSGINVTLDTRTELLVLTEAERADTLSGINAGYGNPRTFSVFLHVRIVPSDRFKGKIKISRVLDEVQSYQLS